MLFSAGFIRAEAQPPASSARAPRSRPLIRIKLLRLKGHLQGTQRGGVLDVRPAPFGRVILGLSQVDGMPAGLHPQLLVRLAHLHAVDEDIPGVAEAYDDVFHRRSPSGAAGGEVLPSRRGFQSRQDGLEYTVEAAKRTPRGPKLQWRSRDAEPDSSGFLAR